MALNCVNFCVKFLLAVVLLTGITHKSVKQTKRGILMKTLEKISLKVKKLPHAVSEPVYATPGAVGMDLFAAIDKPTLIKPMERLAVPTGLIFEVPEGYEAQVRARSGLALNDGLTLVNAVGTIDSDYRGEVKVLLINLGHKTLKINSGDRIAQVVIAPVVRAELQVVLEVSTTDRSSGGFGSTGLNNV
jgi:dUTP pyrophosphatase